MAAPIRSSRGASAAAAGEEVHDALNEAIAHKNEVETPQSFLENVTRSGSSELEITVTKKRRFRRDSSTSIERLIMHDSSKTADIAYTQGYSEVLDIYHLFGTVMIEGREASLSVLLQAQLDQGTACGAAVIDLIKSLEAELAAKDSIEEALEGLFLDLHHRIGAETNPYGGSSILLVLQTEDQVYIANSGLSRAILMNQRHASFQECPLTYATEASGIGGEMPPCSITTIQKNGETTVEKGKTRVGYKEGDLILLANHGFTNIVSDLYARIALDRLKDLSLQEQTQRLVRAAFDEGSMECLMIMLIRL